MPFIVDDILVSFDNQRALATLESWPSYPPRRK